MVVPPFLFPPDLFGPQQRDQPDQAGYNPHNASNHGQHVAKADADRNEDEPCDNKSGQAGYVVIMIVHLKSRRAFG